MNNIKILFLAIISLYFISCEPIDVPSGTPQCIKTKIRKLLKDPVTKPPVEVWQYKLKDKIVYYIPPKCCDQYSELYDSKCNLLCHPDGGFGGGGDGACPDFFKEKTDGKLIWKDNR